MQETQQHEPARLAPGTRVIIRDEEWLIRSVDPTSDAGSMLTCDGVSELVAGQTRLFLTKLEESVAHLHGPFFNPTLTESIPIAEQRVITFKSGGVTLLGMVRNRDLKPSRVGENGLEFGSENANFMVNLCRVR